MVIFKEIEMEGFKKYENKKEYVFEEGLLGIFGKNESGKSTIGDAINVSLFGVSGTPYNKSDIVSWSRSSCKLRLDFEVDKLYRVKRTIGNRNSAVLEIKNNGSWNTIENTITSVDNRIQDILGLDFKSFKNSIFIGQNELNSLSNLDKGKRQAIINRLSRYDELSKAEKYLKDVIKEDKNNLKILYNDFKNLNEIVDQKNEKFRKLTKLIEEKSMKENELNKENDELKILENEIKIFEELKKLDNINDKIDSLNRLIIETKDQLSLIEKKESDKKILEEKIENLAHVNENLRINVADLERITSELKDVKTRQKEIDKYESLIEEKETQINSIEEKESQRNIIKEKLTELRHVNVELNDNIEKIGNIISNVKEIKSKKSELEKLESLIDEKEAQISKIEVKELEKEKSIHNLEKFRHITPELKDKIDNLSHTLSNLNNINMQLDKTKNRIEELKKNITDSDKLINEKENQLNIIDSKENKINDLKLRLNGLDHVNSELENKLDSMGGIISTISSFKTELRKVEEDKKTKHNILKDKGKLKKDHAKYAEFLEINNILDVRRDEINETESIIDLKKQELGELNKENVNLNEIENEYENKLSKANNFVFSGALIIIIGVVLGFVFNYLLILITIIGVLPSYKGFKDRKTFKAKLNLIKGNREIFGYLKELERKLTNLKYEYKEYEQKFNEFTKLDINLLKEKSNAFENLSNVELEFKELEQSENNISNKKIKYEKDLKEIFESLPEHYKKITSLNDEKVHKILYNLYQDENKTKSIDQNSLSDLNKQVIEKSEIQNQLNKFLEERQTLEAQLNGSEKLLDELLENRNLHENDLKELYNSLPIKYKNQVPIHNERVDKEILFIYQEEDKNKGKLLEKISGLEQEIKDKPDILNGLKDLEKNKLSLAETISNETKTLNSNLKTLFEILPSNYKVNRSYNDVNLYKDISTQYQREDKIKNNYEDRIKELDKEIDKKTSIQNYKTDLVDEKTKIENEILEDNKRLNEELNYKYENLPEHYKNSPITDINLSKKTREIYQSEDKEKNRLHTKIDDLTQEIKRKKGIQDKLSDLEKQNSGFIDESNKQKELIMSLTDIKSLNYDEKAHKDLIGDFNRINEIIKEYNREIWNLNGNINSLSEETEDLESKKENLSGLKFKIEKEEFNRDVNEIAKNEISYTAKALREQVMERTTKYVANFLPKITNNKYRDVKIEEDFKIKIYSPEKTDFVPINSLSGGARDQVLFALRLAFTNAIIGGRSRSKGFALFLDEFLGSFDQNRRIRTLKMLRGLKDYFKQIFLISHIDGMEHDVDQVIRTPEQNN